MASRLAKRFWYATYSRWRTASVEQTSGVNELRMSSLAKAYLLFFASAAFLAMASHNHRQQCNDTTYNLLLSFWRKNFASTIFAGWISLTGSTLLSSAVRQKLFFFKVHIFVTHPHKHFSRSITKKCHRHVHRPPATILHSTTNCAIGSQSFLQISFLANFEGQMLLSKR